MLKSELAFATVPQEIAVKAGEAAAVEASPEHLEAAEQQDISDESTDWDFMPDEIEDPEMEQTVISEKISDWDFMPDEIEIDEEPKSPEPIWTSGQQGEKQLPDVFKEQPGPPFIPEPFNRDIPKPLPVETREFLPANNGTWGGERGESTWHPDPDYIPPEKYPEHPCSNPDNLTWQEILDKYEIDGIPFKDGFPDFSSVCKGEVEIEGFSTVREDNFDKADIELAKQKGCTPEEVEQWRKENGYTWHECEDMKIMQKVPQEVHANVPHEGGVSQAKKGNGE